MANKDIGDYYAIGGYITGFFTFFAIWIYAFASWGFLIGLAIGWLPAIIGAVILGFLWPLAAIALTGFILLILSNS